MSVTPVKWEAGELRIIDQTLLPVEYREIPLPTVEAVWEAIKTLRVRGAPAIGVCAAFGVIVGVRGAQDVRRAQDARQAQDVRGANCVLGAKEVRDAAVAAAEYLATSRPTAVNLFWALDRMKEAAEEGLRAGLDGEALSALLEGEAVALCEDDTRRCRAIGDHGAALIHDGDGALTHCNAGALATSAYGTALAVFFRAYELGRRFRVFADETRPLLQGARLTAWELAEAGIDVTLICDNMAAQVMREGRIQLVVVGADRIAANGDTANKIGTYSVAQLAKAHNIPFYVAAPLSTFDLSLASGEAIPIEQRDPKEITHGFGRQTAPEGIAVYNPAFDVTPAGLIAGLITEEGILGPPYEGSIAACLAAAGGARRKHAPASH